MVVCRYFQQGHCRFGNNCRFEHVYPNAKYHYSAPQNNAAPSVSVEQLLSLVQAEVTLTLRSGQWLLSCYAPFKGKNNFPGIIDFSPEEIRYNCYLAQAAGALPHYLEKVRTVENVYRRNYNSLLHPTHSLSRTVMNLYNGHPVQAPFDSPSEEYLSVGGGPESGFQGGGVSINNNFASSGFGHSQVVETAQSIFGGHTAAPPQNVFQPAAISSAASALFASANAQLSTPSGGPLFGPAVVLPAQPQSVFAPAPPSVLNNNNVYSSPFQPPQSGGGRPTQDLEGIVYSNMKDLMEEEVNAFECEMFEPGGIPEAAPSVHLCQ